MTSTWGAKTLEVMLLLHKKHTRNRKQSQAKMQRQAKALSVWIELAAKLAVLINALAELIHKI
jgi:hypothetical protein